MHILLTGANGYVGQRLLPGLLEQGHHVHCVVRDKRRLSIPPEFENEVEVHEHDFNAPVPEGSLPENIEVAYYLIHAMRSSIQGFSAEETKTAENFVEYVDRTKARQIIYLSGMDSADSLSEHLESRRKVGEVLMNASVNTTILKAGIIVGSGSASFEIIRDLVEKLPFMITPRWLNTKCQPIAIRNVIEYLIGVIDKEPAFNRSFDIGGPEVLTYKEMLLKMADVRGLKRWIWTVPVMTPHLSSYWLFFVTSTSYPLAVNLVHSMKVPVIAQENDIRELVKTRLIGYRESVELAFSKIKHNLVLSSWTDSLVGGVFKEKLTPFVDVPDYGCFVDKRTRTFNPNAKKGVIDSFFAIGGERGWYYGTWLWRTRGLLDKLVGGVGLRRGRRDPHKLKQGDALDFWRVLLADQENGKLLLFAEMKLPGDAWLEFRISENSDSGKATLTQKAIFRPKGIWGRLYWFSVWPFHHFIFNGMINSIVKKGSKSDLENTIERASVN